MSTDVRYQRGHFHNESINMYFVFCILIIREQYVSMSVQTEQRILLDCPSVTKSICPTYLRIIISLFDLYIYSDFCHLLFVCVVRVGDGEVDGCYWSVWSWWMWIWWWWWWCLCCWWPWQWCWRWCWRWGQMDGSDWWAGCWTCLISSALPQINNGIQADQGPGRFLRTLPGIKCIKESKKAHDVPGAHLTPHHTPIDAHHLCFFTPMCTKMWR